MTLTGKNFLSLVQDLRELSVLCSQAKKNSNQPTESWSEKSVAVKCEGKQEHRTKYKPISLRIRKSS